MIRRRSSPGALALSLLPAALALAGCSSAPEPARPTPEAELQPETRNPEAPPFGAPRPKIRPSDVTDREE